MIHFVKTLGKKLVDVHSVGHNKVCAENYPGKRPQTVWGGGAKGYCTERGGDDDDDFDDDYGELHDEDEMMMMMMMMRMMRMR